jgi:predicted O-methyltransferase YrrM
MKLDVVLRETEELSKREYLPIIGPEKGKHLADTVRRFHVKSVLEAGTLIGYSAILIASSLPQEGRVVTVEMKPRSARLAEENIRRAGLTDRIELHIGDALAVIPRMNGKFDMVFLDATKNEYLNYLKLSEDKLETGGVVFADNVKTPAREMRDYLDYVRNQADTAASTSTWDSMEWRSARSYSSLSVRRFPCVSHEFPIGVITDPGVFTHRSLLLDVLH